jgi:hypothetical protein
MSADQRTAVFHRLENMLLCSAEKLRGDETPTTKPNQRPFPEQSFLYGRKPHACTSSAWAKGMEEGEMNSSLKVLLMHPRNPFGVTKMAQTDEDFTVEEGAKLAGSRTCSEVGASVLEYAA